MTALHLLVQMARNSAWANDTLFDVILPLDSRVLHLPRPVFFGSIIATLNHIHSVDLFYIDALEGGGLGREVYTAQDFDAVDQLAKAQADADARLIAFCEALTEQNLSDLRRTERPDGSFEERVDALLLHLFQHQVHHRGQVHGLLSHAGVAPPQLDDFHLEYGRVPSAAAYWG